MFPRVTINIQSVAALRKRKRYENHEIFIRNTLKVIRGLATPSKVRAAEPGKAASHALGTGEGGGQKTRN